MSSQLQELDRVKFLRMDTRHSAHSTPKMSTTVSATAHTTTAATAVPLTTTFIPAPTCAQDIYVTSSPAGDGKDWQWIFVSPKTSAGCLPSGYLPSTDFYFSPGISQKGFQTACTTIFVKPDGGEIETLARCCPR